MALELAVSAETESSVPEEIPAAFVLLFTNANKFGTIQAVINMTNFIVDLIIVGIILGLAGVCALFCALNKHKDEIWEVIMEVIQFKEERDNKSGKRAKKQTKIPSQKEKKH